MKIKTLSFLFAILVFVNLSCIRPIRDIQYFDALKEARSGNIDFAFMKLNNYLSERPDSNHAQAIKFAVAEYSFQIRNYRDAIYKLVGYIEEYPEDDSVLFARAILYKALLEYKQEPLLIEKVKRNLFLTPLFLIFSESKAKNYESILNNTYKIIDYFDKIEIFKNDDLFLKITP